MENKTNMNQIVFYDLSFKYICLIKFRILEYIS